MYKEFLTTSVFAILLLSSAATSFAEESKLTAQGSTPVKQSLENLKGKMVSLRLRSGQDISGQVADIGEKAVVLTQLVGKEYFDAVVAIEGIDAVTVRVK